MPEKSRQHITEIEIDATPDQVFRAITEAEGIARWFAPYVKVEPGPDGKMVGGRYSVSWDPAQEGNSTILAWEPGKRFTAASERARAYGSETEPGPLHKVVVDYQIEAKGGKTILRLVHSGFGEGEGWDAEFNATRTGWPIFLWILKHGLERHPGVDTLTVTAMAPRGVSAEEAWKRLIPAGLKPGDTYQLADGTHGTVRTYEAPSTFGGNALNLGDGLIGIYCDFSAGPRKFVNVTMVLWGEARSRAAELKTAWTEKLKKEIA